jgi:hypothetical protein
MTLPTYSARSARSANDCSCEPCRGLLGGGILGDLVVSRLNGLGTVMHEKDELEREG